MESKKQSSNLDILFPLKIDLTGSNTCGKMKMSPYSLYSTVWANNLMVSVTQELTLDSAFIIQFKHSFSCRAKKKKSFIAPLAG